MLKMYNYQTAFFNCTGMANNNRVMPTFPFTCKLIIKILIC